MVESPLAGAAWGCLFCGASGPLTAARCRQCDTEQPPGRVEAHQSGIRLYNEALSRASHEQWHAAISSLTDALEAAGPDPGILGLLGLLYCQAGRVAEALAAWRQAGDVGPFAQWGVELRSAPETTQARAALQAYNEAVAAAVAGDCEGALRLLAPAVGSGSQLAQAFMLNGLLEWAAGRPAAAEAPLRKAAALDPSIPGLPAALLALAAEGSAPAAHRRRTRTTGLALALAAVLTVGSLSTAGFTARQRSRLAAHLSDAEAAVVTAQAAEAKARSSSDAAQSAQAQAQAGQRQEAERMTAALALMGAAQPPITADETERLLQAAATARQTGVAVPAWIDQSLAPARVRGALERYFAAGHAFAAGDYAAAGKGFAASLALANDLYCSDDAVYLSGKSAELTGDAATALQWYDRLVKDYPDSVYQDDALWFAGKMAEKAGDRTRASQAYRDLLSRFAASGYAADARQALSRLSF